MSGYTRQQSYIDGDVILAEHTNDEFDLLEEVFDTSLGHKHDGSVGEGPTIDLLSDNDGDTKIQVEETADDDTIRFDVAGTERMAMPSGNNPVAINHFNTGIQNQLVLNNTGGDGGRIASARSLVLAADYDNNSGPTESYMSFETDSSEAIRIDNTQNVGIGTTSPQTKLHVSSGNPNIRLESTNTAAAPKMDFYGKDAGGVVHRASFDYKSTSELQLHADAGNAAASSAITMYVDGTSRASFNNSGQIVFSSNGTVSLPSLTWSGDLNTGIYHSGADTLNFSTGGTNRLTIGSTGTVTVETGDLVINDASVIQAASGVNNQLDLHADITGTVIGGSILNGVRLNSPNDIVMSLDTNNNTTANFWVINNAGTEVLLRVGDSNFQYKGNAIWHASNDGAGSTLDADLLDGREGAAYAALADAETITGAWEFSNNVTIGNNLAFRGRETGGTVRIIGKINTSNETELGNIGVHTLIQSVDPVEITAGLNITANGLTVGGGIANSDGGGGTPSYRFSSDTDTGMYRPAGNSIGFYCGATERVRFDSAGNVGIGETSPLGRLHVKTASSGAGSVNVSADELVVESATAAGITLLSASTGEGNIYFGDNLNSTIGRIQYVHNGDFMRFYTNNTERVRIDSSGNALFDTTSLTLFGDATGDGTSIGVGGVVSITRDDHGTNQAALFINKSSYVSGVTYQVSFRENGTTRGTITTNGSTTAYNTTSDYRLKENVVVLVGATDRLKELKPSRFNFIGREETVDGFIAHEVQEVVPEAVTGNKDQVDPIEGPQYQMMDASKLVPLLTAALQESIKRIESLEEKIAGYEKDLVTYDRRLSTLENR